MVQLHIDAEATVERLRGRVEHVHSGESMQFDSVGDLLSFMGEQLRVTVARKSVPGG